MRRSAKALALFLFLVNSLAFAQTNGLGNSPYSMYGVGDLIWDGTTRNIGMGGTGVASPRDGFVQILNPALLVYSRAASFEMAALGQYKTIQTESEWQSTTGATLHYGVLALPLHRRWTSSLGLMPFTEISYERTYGGAVTNQPSVNYTVNETGSGGLSKVFWGNGVAITRNFSLGLEASYFFGTKDELSIFTLDIPGATSDAVEDSYYFDAFDAKLGAYYSFNLDTVRDIALGFGLTYNLSSELRTELTTTRVRGVQGTTTIPSDTFGIENSTVVIPQTLRFGFNLTKGRSWSVTADISYSPWESFRFEGENPGLRNSMNYYVGGEFVPNPNAVSNIFVRSFFRIGAYYKQPPYPYNEQYIEDFGINFGLSLPITKFAYLNLAAMIGQRGTTDYGLIKENYNRFSLGLVINDSNWFKRLKLE